MSDRMLKVNELIRNELAMAITHELELPKGCIVSILNAKVSADLNYALISISIVPDEFSSKVLELLQKNAKTLQSALADKIVLRRIPKLSFRIDDIENKASQIDELLDNLKY